MKSFSGYSTIKENKIILETEVPGYDKKDIDISFKKDSVSIATLFGRWDSLQGIRISITADNEKRGEGEVDFFVDESYDVDESKATVEYGLLTIEIPKKKSYKAKGISIL